MHGQYNIKFKKQCDIATEAYNLSRFKAKHNFFFNCHREHTVLEILPLVVDRRSTVSQKGESGLTNGGNCLFQRPRGLRRGSAADRLLGLRVRIPSGAWMSGSCECRVLLGLCVGLITNPEESYRV